VALASALLTALIPKCPLCLAASLSILGVTVRGAGVAVQVLRPLGLAISALALGCVLAGVTRRHVRR
jgi:hypothetical protein